MAKLKKISKNIKCKGIRNSKNLNSYPSRHIFSPCYTYFISFTRVIGENSGAAEPSRKKKQNGIKFVMEKKNLKIVAVDAIAIMRNKSRKRLKSLR